MFTIFRIDVENLVIEEVGTVTDEEADSNVFDALNYYLWWNEISPYFEYEDLAVESGSGAKYDDGDYIYVSRAVSKST
ncbi:hypothetical protein EDM54_01525 [Brevibacillus borstelensis]|uniref:hypothetical protein n=1 Tax=Brevibacillus borstelensis TaxID=45462 RepID=UPI00057BEB76|nr:hypothetical protein [Brevibacillus borstelensis]MED1881089.1 hypothetical protein [Brevibacillus borstelensis]MED2006723.1 hypothetical protein [Brevibacillus borstelensis]RNB66380.1 hypothetical protein EDM54_01525 [Brevibacillus borstelensis]GED53515.1 hypothetical protein BBO01nite_27560 [Brevibacillus borstelensis]